MSKLICALYLLAVPVVVSGQFTHSFFLGPSITKNRLLLYGVDDRVYIYNDGPTYKLFYNLGYRLEFNWKRKFGLCAELQYKKVGSDRVEFDLVRDRYQDAWQYYISIPTLLLFKTDRGHSFGIGYVLNYRLDEAKDNTFYGAYFKIDKKYKYCHDVAIEYVLKLNTRFFVKIRWEEGLDPVHEIYLSEFKNRSFHFSLMYKIK
ncbi:MAG: hypothetical protein K1X68_12975 [Saprospiraceae bacterium]|nr:hypothetical protein [Saprospiraceae bacterium]HMW39486.1 hypothetical protein [Saprospiraceae bacterium]HMX88076.1 hypothetical protein [Saprospiraceae bacterium]HMZ38957.1 hypothetical protein [Saprospiraceae bacterium]HNA65415.1 hypothetical protein [Saprospiraceae bacterium]